MGAINVLPKNIAELIAAGEVIERPSSVIKELVENSIDAGAEKITVEIQHGGITYMRVSDDGGGLEHEDVRNAFLRHATSKISRQDDLDAISTLGFRGEALASICAVSKVELLTKSSKEENGTRYVIEGGEEKNIETIGCPQGTTFIVRDIFYNVPARMKFLKKDVTEGNAISSLLERIALSHPEIGFTLIRDGKQTLKTQGDGKLENAVFNVFGKEFFKSLIPVSYSYNNMSVWGFVTKPVSSSRANRTMQMFYINGRYVRSKTAMAALEQAYRGSIMTGKYPSCVLLINMNCSMLDVNVHPAKLEVRFTNETPVFDCVYHAVRSAVTKFDTRNDGESVRDIRVTKPSLLTTPTDEASQMRIPSSEQIEKPLNNVFSFQSSEDDDEPEIFIPRTNESDNYSAFEKRNELPSDAVIRKEDMTERFGAFEAETEINVQIENPVTEKVQSEPLISCESTEDKQETLVRYIGEAFRTYIILEYGDDRIMFIDKHAAHERLIYERLKKEGRGSNSQMLLSPVSMTLDNEECRIVLEHKDMLSSIGFDVDSFGDKTIIIRSAPVMLEKEDIVGAFSEIADYLCKHRKIIMSEKMEWIYANTACRAAIKAGNINHSEELIQLARTLEENPDIKYCPHGRPIYFFMSKHDIEKSFGRIQ